MSEPQKFEVPAKGMLVYDMPVRLGSQLRRRIAHLLLHVNNSVKIGRWDDKALVEAVVSEVVGMATPEEMKTIDVRFLGQHQVSDAELTDMAKKAAVKTMNQLLASIRARVDRVPELLQKQLDGKKIEINDLPQKKLRAIRSILNDVKKRAEQVTQVTTFLAIEGSTQGLFASVKDLLGVEAAGLEKLRLEVEAAKPPKPPKAPRKRKSKATAPAAPADPQVTP